MRALLWLLLSGSAMTMWAEDVKPPQVWLNGLLSQRLDYGLELAIETEQRFSSGERFYDRYEITPQLIWHYSPRYDFSIGYEENRQWTANHTETAGHEAFATVTLKYQMRDWLLTSRQRIQYGVDNDEETSGVFRQRTQLSYELPRLPWRLKPFLADEWFYDIENGNDITENRLQLGVSYQINRAWRIEVYGMRLDQWNDEGNLTTTPVTGINVNVSF
jgi:hypothetical protein